MIELKVLAVSDHAPAGHSGRGRNAEYDEIATRAKNGEWVLVHDGPDAHKARGKASNVFNNRGCRVMLRGNQVWIGPDTKVAR